MNHFVILLKVARGQPEGIIKRSNENDLLMTPSAPPCLSFRRRYSSLLLWEESRFLVDVSLFVVMRAFDRTFSDEEIFARNLDFNEEIRQETQLMIDGVQNII